MKLTSSRITWWCHSLLHLIKSAKIASHVASSCRSSGTQTEFYWHHNKQITMPNASFNGGKGACNNDKTFRFLIKDLYFSRNSNKFTDCIYRTFIFSWKRLMLGFQENQLSTGIPRNFSLSLPLSLSIHGSHYNVYVLPLRSCDARTWYTFVLSIFLERF